MDIERLTHSGYKLSVVISIVLSALVVTIVAFLGRGTLNLKGELLGENTGRPTDATVIVLIFPKLSKNIAVIDIDFLREGKRSEEEASYFAYRIKTSDGSYFLAKVRFSDERKKWELTEYELLHGS